LSEFPWEDTKSTLEAQHGVATVIGRDAEYGEITYKFNDGSVAVIDSQGNVDVRNSHFSAVRPPAKPDGPSDTQRGSGSTTVPPRPPTADRASLERHYTAVQAVFNDPNTSTEERAQARTELNWITQQIQSDANKPARGEPGTEFMGPGGVPLGVFKPDGTLKDYDQKEQAAAIARINKERAASGQAPLQTPATGGSGGSGGSSGGGGSASVNTQIAANGGKQISVDKNESVLVFQMPDGSLRVEPNPAYEGPKPKDPQLFNTTEGIVSVGPDGQAAMVWQKPDDKDLFGQAVQRYHAKAAEVDQMVAAGQLSGEEAERIKANLRGIVETASRGFTPTEAASASVAQGNLDVNRQNAETSRRRDAQAAREGKARPFFDQANANRDMLTRAADKGVYVKGSASLIFDPLQVAYSALTDGFKDGTLDPQFAPAGVALPQPAPAGPPAPTPAGPPAPPPLDPTLALPVSSGFGMPPAPSRRY
jgi:hypothetical protein